MLVRRIRRKCGILAGLGLITKLFFATGLCNPRGIATGGLIGTGLGLPRQRPGACGFNYHMLRYGAAGIDNTGSIGYGAGRVHPGGVHGKLAIEGIQAKEAAVIARSDTSGSNMCTTAYGNGSPAHAGHRSIDHAPAVCPAIDQAAVDYQRTKRKDAALRTRRAQRACAAKRKVTPHLKTARAHVSILGLRLVYNILTHQRYHQIAFRANGLVSVIIKLQMVGIGPRPAGARDAGLIIRLARDGKAIRTRGIRRPAWQNA